MKPVEKHPRSIAKSISYRLLSLTADSMVAYFFTRDIALSAGIVILVNAYSTLLYYFHERVWAHILWGRQPQLLHPELRKERF
jgi:uncharacterized membrane protein